ncbi:unnamed protein product [Allacma fusca]|uniref:Uncharacterized protein n=1 Tax=Allacma fusca TaxID=39272 RepID=A0A8J2LHH1_9HEXA|nr:unnamed protein product [Allacma fusca]
MCSGSKETNLSVPCHSPQRNFSKEQSGISESFLPADTVYLEEDQKITLSNQLCFPSGPLRENNEAAYSFCDRSSEVDEIVTNDHQT